METFKKILGAGGSCVLDTGLPVLGDVGAEAVLPHGRACGVEGEFALFEADGWLVGGASLDVAGDSRAAGLRAYTDLLAAARGWNLARIWNYVPAINEVGSDGLENYRAFSQGRSLAFEARFGSDFARQVPAASAVGTSGEALTVVFVATREPVRFVENPLQVPAYNYPNDYGPRAPSFARATVTDGSVAPSVFISGTAAIRGHTTMAPLDTLGQVECMLENLREILIATDMERAFGDQKTGKVPGRFFKIYIRHEEEFERIREIMKQCLLRPDDLVHYLRSDICRADLSVEIESTYTSTPLLAAIPAGCHELHRRSL